MYGKMLVLITDLFDDFRLLEEESVKYTERKTIIC